MRIWRLGMAAALCITTLAGGGLRAQGVQAAMNMAEEAEQPESTLDERAEVLAQAREDFGALQSAPRELQAFDAGAGDDARDRQRDMDQALHDMARSLDNPFRFERALRRYNAAAASYNQTLVTFQLENAAAAVSMQDAAGSGVLNEANVFATSVQPGPHTLVERVAFSLGYTTSLSDGRHPAHDATVSTNLLGAALGSAIGALGVQGLSGYVERNVVVGAGLSLAAENKISGAFGFGLGGLRVGRMSVWPVINIEQVDTADGRVPSAVRLLRPAESTWSNVALSFGIVPYTQETFVDRVGRGRAAPVLVVGVTLPVFYPGDPASTLAAMFTDNRRKFERSGDLGLLLGVSLPLLRLDRDGDDGGS